MSALRKPTSGGGLTSPIGLGDLPPSGIDPGVLLYTGGAWTIVDPESLPQTGLMALVYGHAGSLGPGVVLQSAPGPVTSIDAGPSFDSIVTLRKISVDIRTAAPPGTDYVVSVQDKAMTTTYASIVISGGTTQVSSANLAVAIPANTPLLVSANRVLVPPPAGVASTIAVTVEVEK